MATGPVYVPILIDGHNNQLRIRNMLGKLSDRPMNPRGPFGISMELHRICPKNCNSNQPAQGAMEFFFATFG